MKVEGHINLTELLRTNWDRRADGDYSGLTPSGLTIIITPDELELLADAQEVIERREKGDTDDR